MMRLWQSWRKWLGVISPYGYLAFFVWAITLAALTDGLRLCLVLFIVLLVSHLVGGRGLKELVRGRFWFLILSLIAFSSLAVGERDVVLGGLAVSAVGFWIGLWMALRATVLILAADVLAGAVSPIALAQLFERWRLRGLGFALGVAVNMLPTMQHTVEDAWMALRLRGGLRRERWRALRLFLVTVTVNALRYGEMVVEAAEARAFSTAPQGRAHTIWRRGDLALAGVLTVVGAGLLLIS